MAYTDLKEELAKILNEDFNNRQSLQEVRRNVFLNSESNKKQQEIIAEKESKLYELRTSVSKIESEVSSKASELEQLKAQLKQQSSDYEEKENGFVDLINELKSQTEGLQQQNSSLESLKNESNNLSIQNADYASKIRELIFHIDAQNTTQENLEKEISSLKRKLNSSDAEKKQLSLSLSGTSVKDEEITALKEELQSTKQKVVLLETQIKTAGELIDAQNKSISNLENINLELKNELRNAFKDYSMENELLIRDNAELISDIDLLRLENEELHSNKLEAKSEELIKLLSQLNIKETLILSLIEEKSSLSSLVDDLKSNSSNSNELSASISSLNSEITALTNQLSELENSSKLNIEALEFEKSNLNLTIVDLQTQQKDLESTHVSSESSKDEAFIDKLFKQIDLLNDEKLTLETDNEDAKSALNELQAKYEGLSQVIENQKLDMSDLEERNKQIKLATTLAVSGKDKTGLKLKINELVREIDKCIALLSV